MENLTNPATGNCKQWFSGNKKLAALLFFCSLATAQLNAQLRGIGDRVKNRTEQKASNKVEQKADEAIDKALDGLFKKKQKADDDKDKNSPAASPAKSSGAPGLGGIMGAFKPVDVSDRVYSYKKRVQIELEDHKKRVQEMDYYVADGGFAIGMEKGQWLVYDIKKNAVVIINEPKKSYNAMSVDMTALMEAVAGDGEGEADMSKFNAPQRTGKTEVISGFKCDEYIMKDEDGSYLMYFTKDTKIFSKDQLAQFFHSADIKGQLSGMEQYGALIRLRSQVDGETSVYTVKSVEDTDRTISMKDYKTSASQ